MIAPSIEELVRSIHSLEQELEVRLALAAADLHVRFVGDKVEFEEAVRLRHEHMKRRLLRYVFGARPLILLTAPVIYSLIVPFVLLDIFVSVYQFICFPVYGIPKVRRHKFMVFDRRYLAYLNIVEKINCAFCSYANGVVSFAREIGSLTEQYWCPIKHARKLVAAHPRYSAFADFGDADGYAKELESQREEVRKVHED